MQRIQWTYQKLQKEALKFTTRNEFKTNSSKAYASAQTAYKLT